VQGVRGYLEQWAHLIGEKSLPGYVLRKGKAYAPADLTDSELEIVMSAALRSGKQYRMKECFYNSQMLVMSDHTDQIKYVEGYGLRIIPTLHAWCTINGKVVDLTWRTDAVEVRRFDNRFWGRFDGEYFGVEIDKAYIARIMVKDRVAKSLLDDVENGWPLLQPMERFHESKEAAGTAKEDRAHEAP